VKSAPEISEPGDAELVTRMTAGDREAFATLFRRHQSTVYRFARQMLGSKEAAEDVTQEVFIALAQSGRRYNATTGSLSTYLYGIARHLVLQRHKRAGSRVEVDIDSLDDDFPGLATAPDPVSEMSRARMIRQLRVAILRLPVHYREVIVMCELRGLSYEEAAAVAGCPVGTIRSRLSRARQMLVERCGSVLTAEAGLRWLIPTKSDC
jgi:RNA polymerase sigma-70 factor, ECF subfamily